MESESEESDEYQPSSDGNEEGGVEEEETDSDEDYTSISEGSDSGRLAADIVIDVHVMPKLLSVSLHN